MKNSLKIAKWEIKRNLKNKSFIISLILTPLIFMFFFFVPSLLAGDDNSEEYMYHVYINDEIGALHEIEKNLAEYPFIPWKVEQTDMKLEEMSDAAKDNPDSVYIALTEEAFANNELQMYVGEEVDDAFLLEGSYITTPLQNIRLSQIGLTEEQEQVVFQPIQLDHVYSSLENDVIEGEESGIADDMMKRAVPGIVAGIILFSIVMTGMMVFQSASSEKKEKVAEIILSSVTPTELMQGKIIGYFVLGITQVTAWILLVSPLIIWKLGTEFLSYLFVPQFLLLLLIAIAGYLLFASIFVGLGATVEEIQSTSNFQGMIMMLPFLPAILIAPVFSNPEGMVAKVASFVPITSPAVLIMRLSIMDEWPWIEIIIALIVLFVSIWLFMKLAGKIFKIGILMYGKNATPKEIWKWMWS